MVILTFLLFNIIIPISGGEVFEIGAQAPVVITTWNFLNATNKAWDILYRQKGPALDAVESGCTICEYEQCDFTVGYGGSPDENGETTLDAMIMDGSTMNMGAVGGIRGIKNAIGVARKVLHNTEHSFLVGSSATDFAEMMGFSVENLTTSYSSEMHRKWLERKCQPNFRKNVVPDSSKFCGPYKPFDLFSLTDREMFGFGQGNHDTIGMVVIDLNLRMASGTSTNGARFKIPGRVGDSPVVGAGSYVDDEVGGAAATGDGDIMMRFVPAFLTVEEMRRGRSPENAAKIAIDRISAKYPQFRGAIVALRNDGTFGAACFGMKVFPFCVGSQVTGGVQLLFKECV